MIRPFPREYRCIASNIIVGLVRGDEDDNKNINSTFHIFNKFHHFSEPAHLINTADARRRVSYLSENSVTISTSTLHIISHVCRMIRRLLFVQVDVEFTTSRCYVPWRIAHHKNRKWERGTKETRAYTECEQSYMAKCLSDELEGDEYVCILPCTKHKAFMVLGLPCFGWAYIYVAYSIVQANAVCTNNNSAQNTIPLHLISIFLFPSSCLHSVVLSK